MSPPGFLELVVVQRLHAYGNPADTEPVYSLQYVSSSRFRIDLDSRLFQVIKIKKPPKAVNQFLQLFSPQDTGRASSDIKSLKIHAAITACLGQQRIDVPVHQVSCGNHRVEITVEALAYAERYMDI